VKIAKHSLTIALTVGQALIVKNFVGGLGGLLALKGRVVEKAQSVREIARNSAFVHRDEARGKQTEFVDDNCH